MTPYMAVGRATPVLETMYWPDEIRSTDQLDLPGGKAASPAPKEVTMARTLVDSLAGQFKPEQYRDEFRSALHGLIESKMKGEARSAKRRKPEPKVVDLMEALQASLAKSQESAAKSGAATSGAKSGAAKSGAKRKVSTASRSRVRKKAA